MTTETTGTEVAKNPLALSDEDFLNQSPPGAEVKQEPGQKTQEELDAEAKANEAAAEAAEAAAKLEKEKTDPVVVDPAADKKELKTDNASANSEVNKDGKKDTATVSTDPAATTVAAKDGTQKVDPKEATATKDATAADSQGATVDYEKLYKQVMAPFKANGKMIEPRSPDEIIQLMQMGANYTRKMQDIQPHRKTLLMLENNGLMDPDKLSFLIDIDKGNPEAIKKLLKDKGVDPLSFDASEESTYLGGNHKVSDDEANFRNVLDDLGSNPEGKATLQTVNSTWDQASKEVLWKEPQILTVMHQQRENGIYDRIAAEVDRQKALGQISVGTPFIQAYQAVGTSMQAQGKFNDIVVSPLGSDPAVTTVSKEPVATRVVTPKPAVVNGDLASAAAASRSTSGKAEKFVNPLAMSDDDFLKQMTNRV